MKRIFRKRLKYIGPLLIVALIIGVAFIPEAQAGCFEFTKTCTDASAAGEPIGFTITAVNCGPLDLVIQVSDPIAGVNEGPLPLAAGQQWTYNGSYYPAQTPSTNTATATVYLPGNPTPVVSFSDSATCTVPPPLCGNGNIDPGETCDPPGPIPGTEFVCRDDCTFCGDGIMNNGEECDFNDPNAPANCQDDCTLGPECALSVEKFCSEPPPVPECTDKIVATTLRYIGPEIPSAMVEVDPDKGDTVTFNFAPLNSDSIIAIDARDSNENELGAKTKIRIDGVEEVIHTSCSTDYVAGQPAPLDNPKGDPSPNWFVENFVDKDSDTIVAVPGPPDLAEVCEVEGVNPGSCADGKPTALVFEYTGEGCVDGNDQPDDKWSCSGDPIFAAPVEVVMTKDASKFTVTPGGDSIGLNQTFEIRRTDELGKEFPKEIKFDIRQSGQTLQSLKMHTSCSKPLEVGDQFGSVILQEFVPKDTPSANVVYTYRVTNTGVAAITVDVEDDPLGMIADDLSIPAGGTVELTETALLSEPGTVTNVVTVSDTTDPACFATDEVTVEVVEPPAPPCTTKVQAMLLRYTGTTPLTNVEFDPDKGASVLYPTVNTNNVLSMPAQNGWTIDATVSGESELGAKTKISVDGVLTEIIHTSCSAPFAAGAPAPLDGGSPGVPGNPDPDKGDPSPNWFVEDFVQK